MNSVTMMTMKMMSSRKRGSLMKKNRFSLLVLICSVFSLPSLVAEDEGFFGMVLLKEKEVLLTRGILEFPLKIEDSLKYGDEIETGEEGRAQISFKSSFISIGPNSYFSIEKEEEKGLLITKLTLEEGSIRSRIIDLDSNERYHVETEKGTVVVTGTDFVTSVGGEGELKVSVMKGSIDLQSEGAATQPVGAMETVGMLDGPATPPLPMTEADVSAVKAELPVPTDQTEGMVLLPDQGGQEVGVDLVAVDSITQGINPAEGELGAPPSVQGTIEIDDPAILPPETRIGIPGFTPPVVIDLPGIDPPD